MLSEVRLSVHENLDLVMPRSHAMELIEKWSAQLGRSASIADDLGKSSVGLFLPDDHPLWDQHSGKEGHSGPKWDAQADLAAAQAFYQPVQGKAKVFLDILIDHPGQQLTSEEIAELAGGALGSAHSVAGTVNGLRRPHQQSGRRYPFSWWAGTPTRYAMKESIADLFQRARRNLG